MSGGRERFARSSYQLGKPTDEEPLVAVRCDGTPVGDVGDSCQRETAMPPAMPPGLARTIQAEIVPRLMLAHRGGTATPSGEPAYSVTPPAFEEIEELARLVISHDTQLGGDYIDAMRMKGMSTESIFVDLLSPAARLLGDMWLRDDCSFADVTVGLSRLSHLVAELSAAFVPDGPVPRPPALRGALVEAPGEQHTFGLQLVREFFRRDGWDIWRGRSDHHRELINLVQDEWISLVGFSMSSRDSTEAVSDIIRQIRSASLNPGIFIMVGGACVADDRRIVEAVGADAGSSDVREAIAIARDHFEQVGRERH